MRGHLMIAKKGSLGAGVPWPLGHAIVTPAMIEFWGSFGLVARRSIERAGVVGIVVLPGYQNLAVFELEDGSMSPVMFQLTRSFRRALAESDWPPLNTTLPMFSSELRQRMRPE
jgi:hypothetical protein